MGQVHVTCADLALPARTRAAISSVLRRIPTAGTGSWPGGVTHLHVARLMHGAFSGVAAVVQVVVHRGDQRLIRVVKCGTADEMAIEWTAYDTLVREFANVVCARIEAASPGTVNRTLALAGELECVVYDHVAQHAGEPEREAVLLGDIAVAAYRGESGQLDLAVRVVETLFRRAAHVFYNRNEITAGFASLREENFALGPDLVIEVDRLDAGRLCLGTPDDAEYGRAIRYPEEVFEFSLTGTPRIADGEMIALNELTPDLIGGVLIAGRADISVEIRAVAGSGVETRWDEASALPTVQVYGRVTEIRAAARWSRMPGLLRVPHGIWADGVITADPFEALEQVLTDGTLGRVRSVVHGDMNVRNVLVVGDQPYLIDYGRTAAGRPLLTDFAWLELGLMRDAFAAGPYHRLVHVQRLLALASRLLDTGSGSQQDIAKVCLGLAEDKPTRAAFRILFALRRQARECSRTAGEPGWWPAYLAQLVLAAHRGLKWPDDLQGDGAIPATLAVAAVAAEWVTPARPFRHWPSRLLVAALRTVAPLLAEGTEDSAVELAGAAVAELDTRAVADRYEAQVDDLRTRMVRHRFAAEAARIGAELGPAHEEFIELNAVELTWPDDSDESVVASDPAPVLPTVREAMELALLGEIGAGKTAVIQELRYRLATSVLDPAANAGRSTVRIPLTLSGTGIAALLTSGESTEVLRQILANRPGIGSAAAGLLVVGAVHLIVEDLDELAAADRSAVAAWLREIRTRLPRVPVLISHRSPGYDPRPLGFPSVLLDGLDDVQRLDHVLRLVAMGRLSVNAARTVLAVEWDDMHGRGREPLQLWMMTELADTAALPLSVGMLYEGVVLHALRTSVERRTLFDVLERVAFAVLDTGSAAHVAVEPALLAELISLGMLRRHGTEPRFVRTFHQDYFAARALSAAEPDRLRDRVGLPAWREPCRILVSLPTTTESTIEHLVQAVMVADPEYAGQLLRTAASRPRSAVTDFLAAQRDTLTARDIAPTRRRRAATALVEYADREAVTVLHTVATDPSVPDEAKIEAIAGLADASERRRPRAAREHEDLLRSALRDALTGTAPEPVRAAAAGTVERAGITGFELLLADLISDDQPWSIRVAAMSALRATGTELSPRVVTEYRRGCQRRLLELERRLPSLITGRQVRETQQERARLLKELADAEHVGWLLDRRLGFEVSYTVADLLDTLLKQPVSEQAWPAALRAAGQILTGNDPPEHWVRLAAEAEPALSTAAVHRVLRDAPAHAGGLLHGGTTSGHHLLVVAAAVPYLDGPGLDPAERLFLETLPSVRPDLMEGLAALLSAIFRADRRRGVRLAWTGALELTERGVPQRLSWPWHTALSRSRGDLADAEDLLHGSDTEAELAIAALASYDFHHDAGPGPHHEWRPETEQLLMSRQPTGPTDAAAIRWALAAATTSTVAALPELVHLARDRSLGTTAGTIATTRYGAREYAPLAEIVTAIGYLARIGPAPASHDAYLLLGELDSSRPHPSVRTATRIGLAYLGDCGSLLAEAAGGDDLVVAAARNALQWWTPGPMTPPDPAEWIGRLPLPLDHPQARQLLIELRELAERQAARS